MPLVFDNAVSAPYDMKIDMIKACRNLGMAFASCLPEVPFTEMK